MKRKVGQDPGSLIYTGDALSKPTKIKLVKYNAEMISTNVFENTNAVMKQVNSEFVNWIHFDNINNPALIDEIGSIFKIHALTLEDVLDIEHLPKVEESDNHLFL
ncbi:MAG TPA: hypothetical protein VJ346_01875, partial [Bacteroidales bacterium]|nr:hypothetical protein [Bacteroidales bacterium]